MTIYPAAFFTFINPVFLLSATLLGFICTLAYWRSGSGWVPIIMHWVIVWVWLMFLGGYDRLHG
ncbi:MAG: CPBP family intramembrane metalloprotease [Leptolyngbyaceae cyanobacterium SM2_3_12]|nr:CPBP family intramembrane metalloprotease [Leptolyngbyaceae cyanobacterium SM2_3_12]